MYVLCTVLMSLVHCVETTQYIITQCSPSTCRITTILLFWHHLSGMPNSQYYYSNRNSQFLWSLLTTIGKFQFALACALMSNIILTNPREIIYYQQIIIKTSLSLTPVLQSTKAKQLSMAWQLALGAKQLAALTGAVTVIESAISALKHGIPKDPGSRMLCDILRLQYTVHIQLENFKLRRVASNLTTQQRFSETVIKIVSPLVGPRLQSFCIIFLNLWAFHHKFWQLSTHLHTGVRSLYNMLITIHIPETVAGSSCIAILSHLLCLQQ